MTRLVSFRPGVAKAQSAFEAMADIYRYLQDEYDYEITVVISESDNFTDDQLDVQTIPGRAWQPMIPNFPVYPWRFAYRRHVDPLFEAADLVLTVDPTAYQQGALAIRRGNKTGTPVWFDASATVNGDSEVLKILRRPIERSLLRRTDRVLATVPKTVERFRDRRLYDDATADAFELLGHPVDTERFAPANGGEGDRTVVLAVTRLVPEKGLLYVLDAIAPILRDTGAVKFHVLGSGSMRTHLQRRTELLGVDDSVRFLGTVPHKQVPRVLQTADIFVNHAVANSHWEEFFGVANLEAMACSVPPVVSDCGGITYAIRNKQVAEIVPQRSVTDIRAAIQRLLEDPERRRRMGQRAREYVKEHYSIERIADRYHGMVQETVGPQEPV